MLEVENVSLEIGAVRILDQITFELTEGQALWLIGGNAAGKTSLFRVISGLTKPTHGRIRFKGKEITNIAAYERARLGITFCTAERQVFPDMSVMENLKMGRIRFRKASNRQKRSLDEIFELFPILNERAHQRAGILSGGEQKILALARALLREPALMLIDEPFLGLSQRVVDRLRVAIQQIHQKGIPTILSEQSMRAVDIGADARILQIERGKIVTEERTG